MIADSVSSKPPLRWEKSKLKTGIFVIPLINIALDDVLNAIRFTHKIF